MARTRTTTIGNKGDGWVKIDLPDSPWRYEAEVLVIDGAPKLVGLRIERKTDSEWRLADLVITSETVRSLPVARIRGAAAAAQRLEFSEARNILAAPVDGKPDAGEVAAAYRAAMAVGEAPRKAIAERWRVSRATASNWIRAARDEGELGQPSGPGLAGETL